MNRVINNLNIPVVGMKMQKVAFSTYRLLGSELAFETKDRNVLEIAFYNKWFEILTFQESSNSELC